MKRLEQRFRGARVLVTGHTGFTGGWLATWLQALGAKTIGIGLPPISQPNLFEALGAPSVEVSVIGDIADRETVSRLFSDSKPDYVIHLAAQPLVSRGYDDPYGTFLVNVMGTLNILEAARHEPATRTVVSITTDKVYDNREWSWGYRESDRLGGKDPYSGSKAAAEIVAAVYQQTMAARGNGVAIATARGGNIIGGGDWSENRVVPDFVRAVTGATPLTLRNPQSTRPWQHVLALAHAYLLLTDRLAEDRSAATAWNFGPPEESNRTVGELVEALGSAWVAPSLRLEKGQFPEANFLHLASDKARRELGWRPPLDFAETVGWTADWYRAHHEKSAGARATTERQLESYRARLIEA